MKVAWWRYFFQIIRYPKRRSYLRMGYGIAARAERFRRSWAPHLQNTKSFLKEAVQSSPQIDTIVILGAGRLLDVDSDWLTTRFRRIILYDLDPQAAREVRGRLNVEYREHDLRGGFEAHPGAFVVSLNILSQLSLYGCCTHQLEERLQRQHLDFLSRSNAALIVLVTDLEFQYFGLDGESFQVDSALRVSDPESLIFKYIVVQSKSWLWELVPFSGEDKNYGERHLVRAYALVPE